MATNDLNKLQEILNSAEDNHALLTRIRKQASKINSMMEELNAMLDPSYKIEKKERKPRAANGTGKGPGRPRKNAAAE
ncbi:hypothetical protein [Hymenobacter actinosclerus]|uniref:Uncharacterized protein n=1 Tax=Hymenobacter actinosclerus TaxID=82805 RepID=A0A1I0EDX3_9BACT|nr:hypothetical protein [Hymenobacter actinosclerus]SET43436.1 hypothetical protein SAMN04487998_1804 [Hymenobacter actinosclerus]